MRIFQFISLAQTLSIFSRFSYRLEGILNESDTDFKNYQLFIQNAWCSGVTIAKNKKKFTNLRNKSETTDGLSFHSTQGEIIIFLNCICIDPPLQSIFRKRMHSTESNTLNVDALILRYDIFINDFVKEHDSKRGYSGS